MERNVIFIFVDGLGLGAEDPDINPVYSFGLPSLEEYFGKLVDGFGEYKLCDGGILISGDCALGVYGRPQSATGTATLFTGINVQKKIGKHYPGLPSNEIREIIKEHNIYKRLAFEEKSSAFANAYQHPLVSRLLKFRASVTTVSAVYGIGELRGLGHLKRGLAVYHDIDNTTLSARKFGVNPISPADAGFNLLDISSEYDLTVFEYFLTDVAGHKQEPLLATVILDKLNQFLDTILDNLPENTLFVLSSDHGNIEDLSTKHHTTNDVPIIIRCKDNAFLSRYNKKMGIDEVADIIMDYLLY
jgi:hypothetical protein